MGERIGERDVVLEKDQFLSATIERIRVALSNHLERTRSLSLITPPPSNTACSLRGSSAHCARWCLSKNNGTNLSHCHSEGNIQHFSFYKAWERIITFRAVERLPEVCAKAPDGALSLRNTRAELETVNLHSSSGP